MSSSTFEVRESESDSEKVIDFGLDTVEENGIMSTQSDGELPKDHTYTKEPDVLQGEESKESDDSGNKLEEMDSNVSSPEKPKFSRAAKTKAAAAQKATPKSKPKKNATPKKESQAKKSKTKKDEIEEEISMVTEADAANNVQEEEPVAEEAPAEESAVPAKRGKKRKIEEKENLLDQNSVEGPADSNVNESPQKRSSRAPKTVKETKKKDASTNDTADKHNLPKGWVRKTVVRKSGKSAGKIDVYIYSPDGNKFRSKPDIAAYLQRTKASYNLDAFDFSKKQADADASPDATPVKIPQKKSAPAKTKTPKKSVPSPKKSSKLLVKIVSDKRKNSKTTKKSAEKKTKASKSPAKGKRATKATSKGGKKK